MPKIADNCRLTRKQEQAILELLNPSNKTLIEVTKKARISERTLRYWMKLPQFQERLEKEKKNLLNQGLDNLRANFNLAAQTLGTLLTDKSPVIRFRASQAMIDYNFKLLERAKDKKPQHPYDDYYEYDSNPDSPSQVMSIYERLNRLKLETRSHLDKMNEELDKKEMEKRGGDEIKIDEPWGLTAAYEGAVTQAWVHSPYERCAIVRIGTHKDGNFKYRIGEHYLLDESKMNFNKDKPKPSDRSIFRKHIGRALLNKKRDDYLQVWNIDFTERAKRRSFGYKRNISKERLLESRITRILRTRFSFRFLKIDNQSRRMGSTGLEKSLIGTLGNCELCRPSRDWLGNYSPIRQIKESGLWLVQHLEVNGIDNRDKQAIIKAIVKTKEWIKRNSS